MPKVLIVFAFCLFVIAAFFGGPAPAAPAPWYSRFGFHPGWAGLACWVATLIF